MIKCAYMELSNITGYRTHKLIRPYSTIYSSLIIACFIVFSLLEVNSVLAQKNDQTTAESTSEQAVRKVELNEKERAWLKAHPEIVLGYTDAFEPDVIVNPDGTYLGIQVDIINELNRRLGTRIRLQIESVPDIIAKAQKKEVDGLLGIHPGYADKLGLLKTKSYITSYPAVFARKHVVFRTPSDLAGKKVAIIDKVFFSEQLIAEHGKGATVLKVKDAEEGLQFIASGQADFFLGATLNTYLLTKYQIIDLTTPFIFYNDPIDAVMGSRSDWPEFSAILDKGLSSFSKEEIEAIVAKWINLPQQKKAIELTPEEQAWLAQKHTVRVRVADFPPYFFIDKDEITGMAVDYFNMISQRSGVKFEFVIETRPFIEAIQSLMDLQGPDLITSVSPMAERKPYMGFSNPYIVSPRMIFTRTSAGFISSIDDLDGKKLAVPRGTLVQKKMAAEFPGVELLLYASDAEAIKAVSTRVADAYIGNLINSSYLLLQRGFANVSVAAPCPFSDDVYTFGIRKDWPELKSIINKSLATMTPAEKAALQSKYMSLRYEHGITPADVLKWGIMVSGSVVFIILIFVSWNILLNRKVRERTFELSESEDRFRSTFEQAAVGIAHVATEGRFLRINQKFCDIVGYSHEEMLSLTFQDITHPDDLDTDLKHVKRLLLGEADTYSMQKRYLRKNGEIVWVNLTVSLIRKDNIEPDGFVAVIEDITENKQAEKKLQQYQQRLKSLASQLVIAEEKERRSIANDLHDHVGHSLALARMQLQEVLETQSNLERKVLINDISNLLLQSMQDTRNLVFELSSPSMNEIGLGAAISEWLEDQIKGRHGLITEFIDNVADKDRKILDENVRALLFRNVRELLTNAVKHARATKVSVSLTHENTYMKIIVADDGIGFDPIQIVSAAQSKKSFGLFSIQERMMDLGGMFDIQSEPDKGCRVTLTVPMEKLRRRSSDVMI